MNLYEILEVLETASADDIKRAYRTLVKTAHPDVGGSAEEFERIKLAYDVLSDAERRARYDASGETAEAQIIDERGEMYAALATMVFEIIQQLDPCTTDIVEAVRNHIVAEKKKLQADVPRFQKLKQMVEVTAARIINSDAENEENPLKNAILNRLMLLEGQMKQAQESIEMGDRMLSFLSSYQYKFDNPYTAANQQALYANATSAYNQTQNNSFWAQMTGQSRP